MSQPLPLRLAKECKGIGVQHLAVELAADLSGQPRQQAPPPVSTSLESSLFPEELQNSCTLRRICNTRVLR